MASHGAVFGRHPCAINSYIWLAAATPPPGTPITSRRTTQHHYAGILDRPRVQTTPMSRPPRCPNMLRGCATRSPEAAPALRTTSPGHGFRHRHQTPTGTEPRRSAAVGFCPRARTAAQLRCTHRLFSGTSRTGFPKAPWKPHPRRSRNVTDSRNECDAYFQHPFFSAADLPRLSNA